MFRSFSIFLVCLSVFVSGALAQNTSAPIRIVSPSANTTYVPPPSNSTIRGRVYYEDTGRPVRRASVMLQNIEGGGGGEVSGLTDINGEFVIRGVQAGTYIAMVNAPGIVSPLGYADLTTESGSGGRDMMVQAAENFDKYVVDGIGEINVQIGARRGGAISGRVIYENGDAAIGVRVEILRKSKDKYGSVIPNMNSILGMMGGGGLGGGQTDDRGMYRYSGLPDGEYIVKVSENVKHNNDERRGGGGPGAFIALMFGSGSMIDYFFPGATDISEAEVVKVGLGQEIGEVNIVIPDKSLFTLSGKVISVKDKKPLAKAKISIVKKGQTVSSFIGMMGRELNASVTDDEGNWSFKELPKGEYSITVEANNSDPVEYELDDDDYASNRPRGGAGNTPPKPKHAKGYRDTPIDDKDVTDVVVELGYGGTITGTVVVEKQKELPSFVGITFIGDEQEVIASTQISRYGGEAPPAAKLSNQFKMENVALRKGRLTVRVGVDKYYVKSVMSGMTDLMTTPLELKEGEVLSGVKITLADDAGTLQGKVLQADNNPAGVVSVLIAPMDATKRKISSFHHNVRSGADGKFEIKLPPGEYGVIIISPSAKTLSSEEYSKMLEELLNSPEKVTIDPEKTSTITLKKPAN